MLVVYEPVCHGLEHASFNTGLLAAGLELYGGRVAFVAEASHIAALREAAPAEIVRAVEWLPAEVAPRRLRGFRARLPHERRLAGEVWKIAAGRSAAAVVASGMTEPGLLALKWKLWSSSARWPAGAVFHGALDQFLYSRKMRMLFTAAMPKRLRYLLLGETIRAEALRMAPEVAAQTFVLPHPLAAGLDCGGSDLDPGRMVFAYLGRGTVERGFPLFLRLARESAAGGLGNAGFTVAGSYPGEFRAEVDALMQAGGGLRAPAAGTGKLSIDDYRGRVREASYIVMPYSAEAYRLTCSGAIFDALAAAKPVIALRTALFDELFSKLGDIGYLCGNDEELARTVREIVAEPPRARYRTQRENLARGRELFGTASIARHLAAALQ